jgi:tetratricopeptide (TPR) repeat protein
VVLSGWSLHAAGYAAMQRGDAAEALKWYEIYVPLVRETENGVVRNLGLGSAAAAFLSAGRLDDAAPLVEQAMALAEFARSPHHLGIAKRVQGQLLVAQGSFDDALQSFDAAIDLFRKIGSRLEFNRAVYHRASLQLARGDATRQAAARADAADARDAFAEMGAVHDRLKVEQLPGA